MGKVELIGEGGKLSRLGGGGWGGKVQPPLPPPPVETVAITAYIDITVASFMVGEGFGNLIS